MSDLEGIGRPSRLHLRHPMLFTNARYQSIESRWEALDARSPRTSNFWDDGWDALLEAFSSRFSEARTEDTPMAWRFVCRAGVELRAAMRESDAQESLFFGDIIALTDEIEQALNEAALNPTNLLPPRETEELLESVERLDSAIVDEEQRAARRHDGTIEILEEGRSQLNHGRQLIINVSVGKFTVVSLADISDLISHIKDGLLAIKYAVELLSDERFTNPLRRAASRVRATGRRLYRASLKWANSLRTPWRLGSQDEILNEPEIEPGGILVRVGTGSDDRLVRIHPGSGRSFKDFASGPELVVVPSGQFTMGSTATEETHDEDEEPQHNVVIPRSFAVGKYAVTFEEWDFCFAHGGGGGHEPEDEGWGRGSRPVINVSWEDAQAYVKWLSAHTGKSYRLLSEAEWEYCCRAGSQTPFWWGKQISSDSANYDATFVFGEGKPGLYRKQTVEVDRFEPNPWGLYQVHGNVREWVQDCWHENYHDKPVDSRKNGEPWEPPDCPRRILRGGAWKNVPGLLRAANRGRARPYFREFEFGFRVARDIGG